MKKLFLLLLTGTIQLYSFGQDRELWISYMDKIARPVLSNLAEDRLKEKMPVELSKRIDNANNRKPVAYLEAFGRTLCGIAPWLNTEGGTKREIDS